jgi:hypothetical protein
LIILSLAGRSILLFSCAQVSLLRFSSSVTVRWLQSTNVLFPKFWDLVPTKIKTFQNFVSTTWRWKAKIGPYYIKTIDWLKEIKKENILNPRWWTCSSDRFVTTLKKTK